MNVCSNAVSIAKILPLYEVKLEIVDNNTNENKLVKYKFVSECMQDVLDAVDSMAESWNILDIKYIKKVDLVMQPIKKE